MSNIRDALWAAVGAAVLASFVYAMSSLPHLRQARAESQGYNVPPFSVPYVSTVNGQSGAVTVVSTVNGFAGPTVVIPVVQFATGFTPTSPGTVANLLATVPCDATKIAFFAVVTDLYAAAANTNEVMRCTLSGSTYYWRPQRTDFAANAVSTGGASSLTCMVNAPTMFYTGSLLSNLSINLNKTNCWPGARFDVANNITLGIFGITVTGLIGSTTKALGLNAHYTFVYDGTDWQFYQ